MSNTNTPDSLPKARWLALALAGITFALFAPAIQYDYVDYDDGIYVYANKDVLRGLSMEGVRYAFTSIVGSSWMPLTWLSHMSDVTMFGPSPSGPHAMNIAVHSLSAAILLLALCRMTGRLWPSVCIAALFAWHPLRNESVAWVAERKDVLSTLLWILGLLAYARYAAESKVQSPKAKVAYALVALCLLLGLMAKPMLVTFPFVLLLLDFWPLNRLGGNWPELRKNLWSCLREKIPLFVLIIIFCGATFWSQNHTGAVNRNEASVLRHANQIAGNYAFYAKKILVPIQLSILHPSEPPSPTEALVVVLVFVAVTVFAIRRAFRQPWLATGWLWFLGTLVPVIGIVQVGHISVAERYSYVPSIGLGIVVVWCIAEAMRGKIQMRPITIGIALLTIGYCVVLMRADLPRWKNSVTLFEAAVKTAPHAIAYNNIAVYYLDHGRFDLAIEPLTRALEMDTNYVKAYINRATAYQKTGRIAEANRDFARLVKIEPRNAEGFNNRADVLLDLGRFDDAINDFTAAIKLSPDSASTYNNRGSAYFMKGDYPAAIADCTKAIAMNPRYANAFNTRGNAYNRLGDFAKALVDYDHAISLSPNDPLAYSNRAAVHFKQNDYRAAWADLNRCHQLGGHPPAALVDAVTQALGQSPGPSVPP